jgi:rhodanese-related sulfurtransferase
MTTTSLNNNLKVVEAATVKQWLEEESVILIDVREPSEHRGEHIPGAILVSLSNFDAQKIPQEPDKKVVLYCRSGNRSTQAAQKLLPLGYGEVIHLRDGLTGWKNAGYPTQIDKNAPISIMRQVQIVTGFLVLTGIILGVSVSLWFLLLSAFVGTGLMFAGITDTCLLANLLAKLPYNKM